ncbi:acyltransferase [Flavobacterium sp. RSP29]|uniref:acyltransferase n=1 Tax=Flavobacterium sp. RSP29 TaxID=3401731 RepID=UPI003AAAB4F3
MWCYRYNEWYIAHFFDSLVRFSVPVFLMITGVLLLSKPITIDFFLKKRVTRVVYPFLIWSAVYVLFNLVLNTSNLHSNNLVALFKTVYLQFKDGASYHFWYVYMLIGIYLFLPIIGKWILNASEKEIRFFLIIWVLTNFFKQSYLSNYIPDIGLTYFVGYIGYPILGFYLYRLQTKKDLAVIGILLFSVGFCITMFGTFLLTRQYGTFNETFYNYLCFNIVLTASGVFLLVKESNIQNTYFLSVINYVSVNSYGIYLSHVLVLFLLNSVGINSSFLHPFIGIIVTSLLCLLLSVILITSLKRISWISHFIG